MRSDPLANQQMPSVICLDCKHSLLHEHFAGECTCGCVLIYTRLPTEWLVDYLKELQAVYHYHRGTPLGSQAKKAYYTLFETLEARGEEARYLAATTRRQEGPLSGV